MPPDGPREVHLGQARYEGTCPVCGTSYAVYLTWTGWLMFPPVQTMYCQCTVPMGRFDAVYAG